MDLGGQLAEKPPVPPRGTHYQVCLSEGGLPPGQIPQALTAHL